MPATTATSPAGGYAGGCHRPLLRLPEHQAVGVPASRRQGKHLLQGFIRGSGHQEETCPAGTDAECLRRNIEMGQGDQGVHRRQRVAFRDMGDHECGAPRQTGSFPAFDAASSVGIYPLMGWLLFCKVCIQSMHNPASGWIFWIVHDEPLDRLPVAARSSLPGNIQDPEDFLPRHRLPGKMPDRAALFQVGTKISRGYSAGRGRTLHSLTGEEVQEERLRRAETSQGPHRMHRPALASGTSGRFLICRVDNRHRADRRADPAAGAEILINEKGCHIFTVRSVYFYVKGIVFYQYLYLHAACHIPLSPIPPYAVSWTR